MTSHVEVQPYNLVPRPTNLPTWQERIQPRVAIRDELIAEHRRLHKIPDNDWFEYSRLLTRRVHRRIFGDAGVGWPIADLLWGEKFFDGIPEDKVHTDLSLDIRAASVRLSSDRGEIALSMNTFPGVFTVNARSEENPHLAYEAQVFIEQGPREYDPGYETRVLNGDLFDGNVISNQAQAARQILAVVRAFTVSR